MIFACFHAWSVPTTFTGLQNAPDEAAHISYVHSIHSGHLPIRPTPGAPSTPPIYEWHQPPLYYIFASSFYALGDRGLRLASILCGFVGILVIYRATRTLIPDDPILAITSAGISSLTPTHIALTSVVNNDAMLELYCSTTLLILIFMLFSGVTIRRACWLGSAIGAAILTKSTGVLLLPVMVAAFLLMWRNGEQPRKLFVAASCATAFMLAIDGWWFLRNTRLYGQPLPIAAFRQAFEGTALAANLAARWGWGGYWRHLFQWTFQSFWAVFGSVWTATHDGAPLFLESHIYLLMGILCGCAGVGLIRIHFRNRQDYTRLQQSAFGLLFLMVGLVAIAFVGFTSHYFQAQGRYLFPAMLPLCILMATGWKGLFPTRYAGAACGVLLLFLAGLDAALFNQIWVVFH